MKMFNLSSFLLVIFISSQLLIAANADWVPTIYTAFLSEKNTRIKGEGEGAAVCIYSRNLEPKELDCEVSHSAPAATVTTIEIRLGDITGSSGRLLHTFPKSAVSNQRNVFVLADIPGVSIGQKVYSVAEQEFDLLNGKWFIIVKSLNFSAGQMQGNLGHEHRFYSRLSGRVGGIGSAAKGLALITETPSLPKRIMNFVISHSVSRPTSIQLTVGSPKYSQAQFIFQFRNFVNPINEQMRRLTLEEEEDFLEEKIYISVTSALAPSRPGEIRGEVIPIDYLPPRDVSFASSLSGINVKPTKTASSARGCMLITLDCKSRLMEYLVIHSVAEPRGAHVHFGEIDEFGEQLFALARAQSPIYGALTLTKEQIKHLAGLKTYVEISSDAFPAGEIRGQIDVDRDWFAYLHGMAYNTPITTSAIGCATFQINQERDEFFLNYEIHHTLQRPRNVKLRYGREYVETGNRDIITFSNAISPVLGDDELLDDDDVLKFVTKQLFVEIVNDDTGRPEIKGQIHRLKPCNRKKIPKSEAEFTGSHLLGPLLSPPPPPPPRDPFVIATITIDNTTVEIRIGNIRRLKDRDSSSILRFNSISSFILLFILFVFTNLFQLILQ